jgi:S1-C subfamily serine protease
MNPMASILSQLSSEARAVASRTSPAVVRIEGGWRPASGVVVADGLILTNAHNVHGEAVEVRFADGRTVPGTVAGVDPDGDLAVITADTGGIAPPDWAPTDTVAVGDAVFAVAASGDGTRLTLGFVSGVARSFRGPRGRRIGGSLEHTAPMAPGSSGSALMNAHGLLIGLNTNRIGGGFYLAIPADATLRERVSALGRGESAERPRLGVGLAPAGVARRMRRAVGLPERDGALVRDVEAGSAAEQAGITTGDLIVAAGDRTVSDADDLADALAAAGNGGTVELVVLRGAEEQRVSVVLTDRDR